MSQWDKRRFDIFFIRIKQLKNYLRASQPAGSFYLFDLKNIEANEKSYLDMLSTLDIFSESISFATAELKYHYLLRRLLLRLVLSDYIQENPLTFVFKMNSYSKPYIPNTSSNVFFNFSHTKDHGFLGVSKRNDIGVDIEKIIEIEDRLSLLDVFAYPEEKGWVLEEKTSNIKFFILWTAKEALVKAIGTGFLAEEIPKLSIVPKEINHSHYESSYKNYKIMSKVEKNLGFVSSICHE